MNPRLFTPGPTPVPERVMQRMAEPLVYHRSTEFRDLHRRVLAGLQYVFQTDSRVVVLTCSGTGGVEATFVSLFSPGDTIIAVNGGKFGERWVSMPRALGLNVVDLTVPWGEAVTAEQVREALRSHPDARAVYLTHCETSTGTMIDLRGIAATIHDVSSAMVCVDGVSSVGCLELRFDEWGIDVCVTGSQKGLMIPPGLACVAMSPRAVRALEREGMPRFYLDLRRAVQSAESGDTPWTPAISLVAGLDATLRMIRDEGIEKVWRRHSRAGAAVRAAVTAAGLTLFSQSPSDSVTAVRIPEGIQWKSLHDHFLSESGIQVSGGQGAYSGRIFRIGHMGSFDDSDILAIARALELAMLAFGARIEAGAAVAAATRELERNLQHS